MHCDCCDKVLTDYEATLRYVSTEEFVNTCLKCLEGLNIEVKGNPALKRKKDEAVEEIGEDVSGELQSLIYQQRLDSEWDDS